MTVTFSEVVAVTGTPHLALTIGALTRQADYQSGPPSTALVFRYTVADTDEAPDGVTIAANALKLNSGSIKRNNAHIDADLTHEAHQDPMYYKRVDGITPVLWTAAVHGHPPRADLQRSDLAVFADAGQRLCGEGEQRDTRCSRRSAQQPCRHPHPRFGRDANRPGDSELHRGNSSHPGRGGQSGVAALTDQAVTTSAPYVSSLEISSMPVALHTYAGREVIELTVTFSESVTVTGTPHILLSFDSTGSYESAAPYVSGSGTPVLVFRYAVAEGVARLTCGCPPPPRVRRPDGRRRSPRRVEHRSRCAVHA